MSFFLSMAENMLGLSPEEQAQIEPCLPALKAIIDVVNANLDNLWALQEHFAVERPTITKIFSDYRVVGPNLSALLGDGQVDIGATTSAAKDMNAAWDACPSKLAITSLLNRLQPMFHTVLTNWPKAKPAVDILIAAGERRGMTMGGMLESLNG